MKALTKEDMLNQNDIKVQVVQVPEWGGEVSVITLTGTERDAFEQSMLETRGEDKVVNLHNMRAKLCVETIVDTNGKRIFDQKDIAALGKKSSAALDRLFSVAQKLCGLGPDDVKELAKNS